MTRPIVRILDLQTKELTVREMNDTEFAQYEADLQKDAQRQTEAATKAAARQALLNKLGITEEEATLLLGGN